MEGVVGRVLALGGGLSRRHVERRRRGLTVVQRARPFARGRELCSAAGPRWAGLAGLCSRAKGPKERKGVGLRRDSVRDAENSNKSSTDPKFILFSKFEFQILLKLNDSTRHDTRMGLQDF